MKVLVVHNRYRSETPGGEDRVVDQEATALAEAGHSVERFERLSDDIARRSPLGRALVPAQVVWSEESRRSLLRCLHAFRPDVVHLHNTFPLVSPSVLYACRRARVPVVATVHNYRLVCASGVLFRDGAVCHDCVGRLPTAGVRHGCYRDSTLATIPMATSLVVHRRSWRTLVSAYVFLSEAQRDLIAADGFPSRRLFVKPNFVPTSLVAPAPPGDVIVYAGRLEVLKGVDVLMAAWDRYQAQAESSCRLRLAIAGAGPLQPQVEAWAKDRPSVEYRGVLSRVDCSTLLGQARAVVVPSIWEEPFGLVPVEAMAMSVPPIASALGSFPGLITDGVDGVLVEPGDASGLAKIFHDVANDPERYRALGRAARQTYDRRFRVETSLELLLDIYAFAMRHPAWQPMAEPSSLG